MIPNLVSYFYKNNYSNKNNCTHKLHICMNTYTISHHLQSHPRALLLTASLFAQSGRYGLYSFTKKMQQSIGFKEEAKQM